MPLVPLARASRTRVVPSRQRRANMEICRKMPPARRKSRRGQAPGDLGGDGEGVVSLSHQAKQKGPYDEEDLRSAGSAINSARWPIVGKFSPGGGYIRGQPRPYLRHLQHGRLGLRIRRGACDFQALRRKPAILAYPPHAENPHRRLRYRNATTAITFRTRSEFPNAVKRLKVPLSAHAPPRARFGQR